MSNSTGPVRSLVTMIYRYRVQSQRNLSQDIRRRNAISSHYAFMFSSLNGSNTVNSIKSSAADHIVKNDNKMIATPTTPGPVKHSFPSWAKWLLGSFLTIVLPFWKQKWAHLLIIGGTVEKVVNEVEIAAEVVEKVATATEKISAKVADEVPDNGILKEAAVVVEHVSTEVAKDAQVVQDIIRKVEEMEHDLTDLDKIMKPIIDEVIRKENVEN